jgi:hypothetical protein
MTIKELEQIAEQSWEGCDGCTEQDKQIWISGFVTGVLKFADIESLPGPTELEELSQKMGEKFKKMMDIPTEYNQIITDNFNNLI